MKRSYIEVYRTKDITGSDIDDIEVFQLTKNGITKPLINLEIDGRPMTIEELNLSIDETYTEYLPDGSSIKWVLPHSKKFPSFINEHFSGDKYVSKKADFMNSLRNFDGKETPPFPYQYFVYEYLRYGTPYRSLLLEHGLGSGKTRSTILVAESFRKEGLTTLIITPAFLATNFKEEICKWVPEIAKHPSLLDQYYRFVSYNATGISSGENGGKGSVFEQLARLGIGFPKGDQDEHKFKYISRKYPNLHPPTNMLIVIEEFHGLNRSFGSLTSKIKAKLYRLLMMAVDCKFIGLSGTPLVSNPFELATMYNVLRGPLPEGGRAYPETEAEFIDKFIDYENTKILNESVFIRRMIGLESYFEGVKDDITGKIYPRHDDNVKIECLMSPYQAEVHNIILEEELEKEKMKKPKQRKAGGVQGVENKTTKLGQNYDDLNPKTSFRTASRQACNFVFPPEVKRPRGKAKRSVSLLCGPEDKPTPFDFCDPDDNTNEVDMDLLLKIYKALEKEVKGRKKASGFTLPKIQKDADEDDIKMLLTHAIGTFYKKPLLPDVETHAIRLYLTENDYYRYIMQMGGSKERQLAAIKLLVKLNSKHGYFNLGKPAPQKPSGLRLLSTKMYEIYRTLTEDFDIGAAYVDVKKGKSKPEPVNSEDEDEQDEEPEDEESVSNPLMDEEAKADAIPSPEMPPDADQVHEPDEEEEDERSDDKTIAEPNSEELPDVQAQVLYDPDDIFMNTNNKNGDKLRDIYLKDEELDEKYGYKKWEIKGGPVMVYSFFNVVEGAGIFSKILEAHGYERFKPTTNKCTKRKPRYAFIGGGMTHEQKKNLLDVFNCEGNKHGQIIRVIFVTQAASEGISLFNLRQIHIMEPFWDNTVIRQVKGRGLRLRSHYNLPRSQRSVHTREYYAVIGDDTEEEKLEAERKINKNAPAKNKIKAGMESTTDQYIEKIALRKDAFQDTFKDIRRRAAVDCIMNRGQHLKDDCFHFESLKGLAYHVTINDDIADKERKAKLETSYSVIADKSGATFIFFKDLVRLKLLADPNTIVEGHKLYEAPIDFVKESGVERNRLTLYGYYFSSVRDENGNIKRNADGKAKGMKISLKNKKGQPNVILVE